MELINQIDETLSFNNKNIRVIGTCDDPWFVAKDICNVLEIKDVSMALTKIPEKWKGTKVIGTLGGNQNLRIINESGIYKLILRSNKPIAEKFQEVVCEEILPTLRKKGEYKIQSIIDRNKELEDENQRLSLEKDEEIKRISQEKEEKIRRIEEETESKLIENNEENRLKICKTIIQSYDNKNVVYLGYIGIINGKETFKFGSSGRLLKRIYKEHNKTYEIFEFVYCIECDQHLKLENSLKSDEKLKKYRFSHPFHVEGSELIYFDDNFTLEIFKKLVIKLKNNIEMVDELRIHLEKTEHLKIELQIKKEEEETKRIAKQLEEQTKQKQLELEILKLKVENAKAVREINDENINNEIKRKEEELTSKIESEREIVKQIKENNNKIFEEINENPNLIDVNIFQNIYKPIQVNYQDRDTFLYVAKINDELYINVNSISEKSYPMDRWKRTAEIKNKILEYNFKMQDKKMLSIYSHKNKGTWIIFDFFCKNYFNWYGSIYNKLNNNTCYLNFGTFLEIQLPKLIYDYDLSIDKHFFQIKREAPEEGFLKVRANRETNFINVTDLFQAHNRDVRSFNKSSERKAYFLTNPEEHYVNGNGITDEFGMKVTFCHPKLAIVIINWLYKKNDNKEKQQVLNFINYFMDKVI